MSMSPKTPCAVTSAPAPGPRTISGWSAYLRVVKEMMLSAPWRVANGWVLGNALSATEDSLDATSTVPTKRSTSPFASASAIFSLISPSKSGSLLMYSSTLAVSRSGSGTRLSTGTSSSSSMRPASRASVTTLRATSVPERSSRGSGSVNPSSLACLTMSEKLSPGWKVLKMYESVPEKIPSILTILSPAVLIERSVLMIGSPAPTLASLK
mmetsp:Transcript_23921/g.74815  ORF Transcript_23921/g.74815 Transcript_23921/m.74815 type:complete len:211 (+) Transcript_23921:205-837(+)